MPIQTTNTAFYSGFMPIQNTSSDQAQILTFTVPVNDVNPVWFYDAQASNCQSGMVGGINV